MRERLALMKENNWLPNIIYPFLKLVPKRDSKSKRHLKLWGKRLWMAWGKMENQGWEKLDRFWKGVEEKKRTAHADRRMNNFIHIKRQHHFIWVPFQRLHWVHQEYWWFFEVGIDYFQMNPLQKKVSIPALEMSPTAFSRFLLHPWTVLRWALFFLFPNWRWQIKFPIIFEEYSSTSHATILLSFLPRSYNVSNSFGSITTAF